ncbi:hypothetical protein E2C01_077355 [Portunus trituberculatus]|uniref:Uncharacterized protein n=1 Tax=Portunus trituberculatus TaxID=210409 RepID=A0A5B7IM20_PORTR|nr:hypothetical protein [Portunus trituberculatus]
MPRASEHLYQMTSSSSQKDEIHISYTVSLHSSPPAIATTRAARFVTSFKVLLSNVQRWDWSQFSKRNIRSIKKLMDTVK